MATHEELSGLLDSTMQTLEGDLTTMIPQNGKGILDQWVQAIGEGENTTELTDSMQLLKTELESGQPNPAELKQQLMTLADQTRVLGTKLGAEGDLAPRLEALSAALRNAAGQLATA